MAPFLLIGAAALGSAAMYFLDPDKGRRRRALVRDQMVKASTSTRDLMEKGARDLKNRGSAVTGRARSLFRHRPATDHVLVERVRAKMGRYTAHPGAIEVTASGGRVTLSGSILAHEHRDLVDSVRNVAGVSEVDDRLTIYETAQGISELQGSGPARRGEIPEALQENWAPATRLVSGAAGTTLTFYAISRDNRYAGFLTFLAGAAILARAITNRPLTRLVRSDPRHGIEIEKTINIAAPVEQVFDFLANYDNFPDFMRNVMHVEVLPDGRSHWKVRGPAGTSVEWDAITTKRVPNERLEWATLEGSPVMHTGSIRVEPYSDGARVHIRMSYSPPAGALGHAVAKLLGTDSKTELDEDLMRLKSTLETGKRPRDAAAARYGENLVSS